MDKRAVLGLVLILFGIFLLMPKNIVGGLPPFWDPDTPQNYQLTVVVKNMAGSPIHLASVDVDGNQKETDVNGKTGFTLAGGLHELTVTKTGYATHKETFLLSTNFEATIVLAETEVARVTFFVYFSIPNPNNPSSPYVAPVEGAQCWVGDKTKSTDVTGNAQVDVTPGTYNVKVVYSDYSQSWPNEEITSDGKSYVVSFEPQIEAGKGEVYIKALVTNSPYLGDEVIEEVSAYYVITQGQLTVVIAEGYTPDTVELSPGEYKIKCQYANLQDEKTVTVDEGEFVVVQFVWFSEVTPLSITGIYIVGDIPVGGGVYVNVFGIIFIIVGTYLILARRREA